MKVGYVKCLGLPLGVRVKQYEASDVVALTKEPKNLERIAEVINLYFRQKDAQVAARDDLATKIHELTKFPPRMEDIIKDGKKVGEAWADTEGEYIDRFVTAVVKKQYEHDSLKAITGTNEEQREASVAQFLQKLADTLGETDDKGVALETPPCYVLDIARKERISKPKTPAKWALEAAAGIINNKNEAKWVTNFTKGRKTAQGIVVDPFAFKPFQAVAPAGAKPEEVEAVRQENITNLAWNLMEDKRQVDAKSQSDYA